MVRSFVLAHLERVAADERSSAALPDEELEEQDGQEGPRQGADEEGEDGSETEGDSDVSAFAVSMPIDL